MAGDAYEKGRPSYPAEAVDYLARELSLNRTSMMVELGAGTGKFTKLLVPMGAKLIAIEPVEGMRCKFKEIFPQIELHEGTAEAIPLPDESADAVIAAQAFHWFSGESTLKEIHRVLKPGGLIGLIWNVRDESKDWVAQLTKIIYAYDSEAPTYNSMKWRKAFDHTSLFTSLKYTSFAHQHEGTPDTVVARVASISFIAVLPEKKKTEVLSRVAQLIQTHPEIKGLKQISFPYRTDIYWCKKK